MRKLLTISALFFLFFDPSSILAQGITDIPFEDPILESRAIDLHKKLRCLVCQNQSIHESNAGLAKDIRIIVREQILKGKTDKEITQYVVDRYGNWVLLNPPLKMETIFLWFGPLIILIIASFMLINFFRNQKNISPSPLSDEERKQVENLLGKY